MPTGPDGHFPDVSAFFPRRQRRVSPRFACRNRVLLGTRGGGAALAVRPPVEAGTRRRAISRRPLTGIPLLSHEVRKWGRMSRLICVALLRKC
ncbi:hypothetical protein [Photorhabdus temperata]|uniref:hypothetical protein n=1 Tax=Photorhabdus temperata TaxID=574560 RepID=UPI0013629D4C|nr:hypothetical protein [Photorhabdus temperata]